jgi:choline dehydrogenase
MLSGIGRPDELVRLRIEPVAELPGVGLNLQDHPLAGASYLSDPRGHPVQRIQRGQPGAARAGPGPAGRGRKRGRRVRPDPRRARRSRPAAADTAGALGRGGARAWPRPRLLGRVVTAQAGEPRPVALVSPDPTAKPLIVHNYFAEPEDMRVQIEGVRLAMEIARTEPLATCLSEPYQTPASDSDEDIESHVRAHAQTQYHPVGSCRMGVDELAVVDPELRVRGVEALRVVDASIMPAIPRANTTRRRSRRRESGRSHPRAAPHPPVRSPRRSDRLSRAALMAVCDSHPAGPAPVENQHCHRPLLLFLRSGRPRGQSRDRRIRE